MAPWYNDNTKTYDADDIAADRQADKLLDRLVARQQTAQQAQFQQFMAQSWSEALRESGLTQEEYNQVVAQDPQAAGKAIKKGLSKTAKKVAQRLGRQSTVRQQAAGNPPVSREEGRSRLEEVAGNKSYPGDDRLDAMIEQLLPSSDPITRYR